MLLALTLTQILVFLVRRATQRNLVVLKRRLAHFKLGLDLVNLQILPAKVRPTPFAVDLHTLDEALIRQFVLLGAKEDILN